MYQIHFTFAMELIAFALGLLLIAVSSSSHISAKRIPKWGGWIIVLIAIGLFASTTFFLYFQPSPQQRPNQGVKVNMGQGGAPTKTGDLKNDPRFRKMNRGKGIDIGGIQLPPMTVKVKEPIKKSPKDPDQNEDE